MTVFEIAEKITPINKQEAIELYNYAKKAWGVRIQHSCLCKQATLDHIQKQFNILKTIHQPDGE
jgi:hypothetical protein